MTKDITFTRYIFREDGTIRFAVPVPDRDDLIYHTEEDGTIVFDKPIEEFEKAWSEYVNKEFGDSNKIFNMKTLDPDYVPKNRTKRRAGNIDAVPEVMPTPSTPAYQYAMSTYESKTAHILPINPAVNLTYENGKLYFDGLEETQINLIDIRNKDITNLDLMTLRVLYGVILTKLEKALTEHTLKSSNEIRDFSVNIYIPELMSAMGLQTNISKKNIDALIAKIASYRNIIGILPERLGTRIYESKYPIMVWMGYDAKHNTISFASPYLNKVVANSLAASLRKNAKGNIITKKNGQPLYTASHSYLIKSTIASEKNKRAAEIVAIVVPVIEQAGNNVPHIKASTIIERHPELKQAIESCKTTANKNVLLMRAFSKAWELLETQTYLKDKYKNIKFPKTVPSMSTLDMVFEFPHDGKNIHNNNK